MRKKKWLVVILIIATLAVGLWIWWIMPGSAIKKEVQHLKPELKIATVNISDIDENKIKGTTKITLQNNLPLEVHTRQLQYAIFIDSAKIIEDSYKKDIVIRSKNVTTLTLPMEVMFKKLNAVLQQLENKKADSAEYTMIASFKTDIPVAGERNFTLRFSKRLPALKIPKATIADITVKDLDVKESSLELVVNIENPNVFPIKLRNGKYSFSINEDENVMRGTMQEIVNVPAKETSPVAMHVDMKTMKIPKLTWDMLFKSKETNFRMSFTGELLSENGMFSNSQIAFNMKGTFNELKGVAAEN